MADLLYLGAELEEVLISEGFYTLEEVGETGVGGIVGLEVALNHGEKGATSHNSIEIE